MTTARYQSHAHEALQVLEHTLHHLSLDHLDPTDAHDLARFERNLAAFSDAYQHDREAADEAWDLLLDPILSLINAVGDGSDELEQHREDLIALSEDFLGTHHNRDGAAHFDDREDNPSKAIINRRRAMLWSVIRAALENAPPGINRMVVEAALGPIVDHLANPPKAAKAAKVKPTKPLKDGQLGEVVQVKVLTPSEGFNGRTQFEELTGHKWQKHEGIDSMIVPARRFGFNDSKRQIVVVDLRQLPEASRKGLFHTLHSFDLVSGIPLSQDDSPRELVKRLKAKWVYSGSGNRGPGDYDELLASVGTVEDIIARDWETTAKIYQETAYAQRLKRADEKLLEAFVLLQRLQKRRGVTTGLPAVGMDTDLQTAFKFLIEYSHTLATSDRGFNDADLAANAAFYKAKDLYGEAAATKNIKHHDYFTDTKFVERLQGAIDRVEDWGDDTLEFYYTTDFDAWKAEKDAKEAEYKRRKEEDEERRREYLASEAARLAKPEEAAFEKMFRSEEYQAYGRGNALYKSAFKALGKNPSTHYNTGWYNWFRQFEFNIGVQGNDKPFVLGKFIEAARQLRALRAKVSIATGPKPHAYRIVTFNLPGQVDKKGNPVTATVKAKPNEPMFYLFDYLRWWNGMEPYEAEPQALASAAPASDEAAIPAAEPSADFKPEEPSGRESNPSSGSSLPALLLGAAFGAGAYALMRRNRP